MEKKDIFKLVKEYYKAYHKKSAFSPGKDKIHYAGRVYNEKEMISAVDAVLDFWLTAGKYTKEFERKFSEILGVKNTILVSSGSSANLVAIAGLMSNRLKDRLKPGDEIITCGLAFPTTVAPIIQNRLVPVFVDARMDTFNIDEGLLEKAVSGRVRAIQVTHTLGNPCDMEKIMEFSDRHDLYVIEDACDALGSKFDGRITGSFGDIATFSFYAAHHIAMGEGGAVTSQDQNLARILRSIRDWGRDCFCGDDSGPRGACDKRFDYFIKEIDSTYDHRYIYSDIGYNLKPTDIQSAIGVRQLEKLDGFIEKRKKNFSLLYSAFSEFKEYFSLPGWDKRADVSWFAFPLCVKEDAGFTRQDIVKFLESKNIETRFIFAGNILNQPGYKNIECRVPGSLKNADKVMKNGFFIGLYPGIGPAQISYIIKAFKDFLGSKI
ncbi:MAG: lipopolysaccharide biosynthesis protein RfbH [Candidatus Omnitrophota bacterium]|nr:lipopolysaccharide biosynthesis protein RfbH [Candidatus Omnitrophota bacterium]